jgi:low temperature requirement protein LtrA
VTSESVRRFRRWFWRPPRAHGDVIEGRAVTALELFYDLVYVAVISQTAHHLAEHVTARGLAEFAIVFSLIWIGWTNGSLYIELHGREDGRTRSIVFGQMAILALLAVFTSEAAGETGAAFAIVYAAFLGTLAYLWYSVYRQDRAERPGLLTFTGRYATGLSASLTAILISAFLPPDGRLAVWAGFGVVWVVGMAYVAQSRAGLGEVLVPSHSLVERFGLFVIIVLGEVVFGVVNGLSSAQQDLVTIATGLIALAVGFGLWWIYFDLVGGRLPQSHGRPLSRWLLSHLPITMAIAAAGAAMVSLIDHAHDPRTPVETGWLLSGAVALALLATVAIARALVDHQRLAAVYRPVIGSVVLGAIVSLAVGLLDPPPWLFALLLAGVLTAIWLFAVGRFLQLDAWQLESEHAHEASYS